MKSYHIPRIVIAGTNSGVGKTTIVTGLLAALKNKNIEVQAFKIGPDYIDPGFHKLASGKDSHNLDSWLTPAEKIKPFFVEMTRNSELAVIEGVMGIYDGGKNGISSTADIAKELDAPVILVIDAKAMGESAAALAKGFFEYDPGVNFAGVILNRIGSDNHEDMIKEALAKLKIPVLGVIRRNEKLQTPERHLGLTPVTEIDSLKTIDEMSKAIEVGIDLEALISIAKNSVDIQIKNDILEKQKKIVKIGVAYDKAFSFYYPISLSTLEKNGAELVYFSPLEDNELPEVDGLIFGGGFPEMFLGKLERNKKIKEAIYLQGKKSIPIYAECGGYMYLCERISDFDNKAYDMVGLIPAEAIMQKKLQKVGYVTAKAVKNNVIVKKGVSIKGHEFHFSLMKNKEELSFPYAFELKGSREKTPRLGGYVKDNILASYLHINFAGDEDTAKNFIEKCLEYKNNIKNKE